LEMLLRTALAYELNGMRQLRAEGGWLESQSGETYKSCKESLTVGAWKSLGFVARLFPLDSAGGCYVCVHGCGFKFSRNRELPVGDSECQ
jgi:hypothetical protein